MDPVRILALRQLIAWGLGAMRKVAARAPSPRPQALEGLPLRQYDHRSEV
jgi:hypothetical protein